MPAIREAPRPARATLLDRYSVENVAGRPVLELAARTWEPDRHDAFRACYRAMRVVDDLVDDARARAGGRIPPIERARLADEVRRLTLAPGDVPLPLFRELARVRATFALPEWPWQAWARSMISDLDRDGFATMRDWLRYCEGACVAPATIFMHLCAMSMDDGAARAPSFDPRGAVRAASLFSYFVHILRDFRDDQANGLQYLAGDAMRRCGVTPDDLRHVASVGVPTSGFHHLVAQYRRHAAHYLSRAERDLGCVAGCLDAPHRLAPAIVLALYRRLHDRTADVAAVARGEVALDPAETLSVIRATIAA